MGQRAGKLIRAALLAVVAVSALAGCVTADNDYPGAGRANAIDSYWGSQTSGGSWSSGSPSAAAGGNAIH